MGGDLSLAGLGRCVVLIGIFLGRAVSRPSPHGALGLPGPQA